MLKQLEEHTLIVRALLIDETANVSQAYNTLAALGYLDANHNLNRRRVLRDLREKGAHAMRYHHEGMGRGTFVLLMRLMLETV